jgi:hypothetical protein
MRKVKDKYMTVENFLNDINEKTWRDNINYEVSKHLDKIIEYMND